MNIQLSVTIWTVICFALLVLSLQNLLFRPILKVMDDRRARIQSAQAKKAEQQRLEGEYAAAQQAAAEALADAQQKQLKAEIEDIRTQGRKAVEAARAARLREVEEYRLQVEAERVEILKTLSVHSDRLAAIFADSLTKE